MEHSFKLPFYARLALTLVGLYLLIYILSIAKDILLPLIYATIIAVVISPLVALFIRKGISRGIASMLVMTISLIAIIALVILLSLQVQKLGTAWPQLVVKFDALLLELSSYLSINFDFTKNELDEWVKQIQDELLSNSSNKIGITITTLGGFISTVMLTPVYTFMLLLYQPHLIKFIHKLFGTDFNSQVNDILTKTKTLIQRYLLGLSIEIAILAVLNSLGLWIIGIDYPILLGILGAFLNIIPYLGGIIGVTIYMVVALITKSPVYVIYIVALYSVIQLIDNNYIVPKIVGSKVRLNALISLMAVIAGAALWGIPGMFISIPFVAIIKLILDHIDSLSHWGELLGDPLIEPEEPSGFKE